MRGASLAAGLAAGITAALGDFRPVSAFVLVFLPLHWVGLYRRRPAFVADGAAFTAPFSRLSFLALAGLLGCLVGTSGHVDRPWEVAVYLAVTAVVALPILALAWQPPAVVLTPGGLLRRRLLAGTRFTHWEDLDAAVLVWRGETALTLTVNGVREKVWPSRLETDSRFLAEAIEYYRVQPNLRAAIGTPAEHQRLTSALSRWARARWGERPAR